MINLEQAEKLKAAGWDQGKSTCVYHARELYRRTHITALVPLLDAPDEKEMMEWLQKDRYLEVFNYGDCWQIANPINVITKHKDLTAALVDACCRVCEERKNEKLENLGVLFK